MGSCPDTALGDAFLEAVDRQIVAVVDTAGDDGAVRVSFQEINQYFVADAGDELGTPIAATPCLGHPQPAGTLVVSLAFPVPVELNLYPAMIVGMNLFTLGTDHNGGLQTFNHRFGSFDGGPDTGFLPE